VPLSTITNSPCKSSLPAASSLRENHQIPLHTSTMLGGIDDLNSGTSQAGVYKSRRHRAAPVGAETIPGDLKDKAECKVQ
jgi:hypothetical protein